MQVFTLMNNALVRDIRQFMLVSGNNYLNTFILRNVWIVVVAACRIKKFGQIPNKIRTNTV